jgi:hypothetical protein
MYRKFSARARSVVITLLGMTPSVVAILPLLSDGFKHDACVSGRKEMGM